MSKHLKSEPTVQEWLHRYLRILLVIDKTAYIDRKFSDAEVGRRARTAFRNTPYRGLITKAKVTNMRLEMRASWVESEQWLLRERAKQAAEDASPPKVTAPVTDASPPEAPMPVPVAAVYTDEERRLLWDMTDWATRQGFTTKAA